MPGTWAELNFLSNFKNNKLQNLENSEGTDKGTDSAFSAEKVGCINEQDSDGTLIKLTNPQADDEIRLAVLTDLLADLPETDRRELIADLTAADRVTIARLLINR